MGTATPESDIGESPLPERWLDVASLGCDVSEKSGFRFTPDFKGLFHALFLMPRPSDGVTQFPIGREPT
jgi:hypothetical protein